MGWLWGNSDGSDPTKNLDPTLKDFLKQETPAPYDPTPVKPPSPPEQQKQTAPEPAPSDKPAVPSASLFPDGRYAHLWKDYKPLEEIEGPNVSPAERVIDQFKRRKEVLNKAALENCSEEHLDLSMCFKTGDLADKARARMTLCRDQNRKFSRCYTMQAKFLQALGYGSDFHFDPEKEERIQMHADKLYHQMLDYEKRADEAKAAGLEPPPPQSLFKRTIQPTPTPAPTPTTTDAQPKSSGFELPGGERVPPNLQLPKSLKNMTPHEREVELQVLRQKQVQQGIYMNEVGGMLKAEDEAKKKRREKLGEWFGPTIAKWLA
ncbi:hypothetical protein FQN53_005462 [Emmonsiellopsis sp. PD_33]|nr:hypothetical protein FQN53_005462 [Emmonsiellopsis sp. PD_33]